MPHAAAVPLAMLIVFASAKLLREVMERFQQPGIVGEILAGVLVGPHVLRWIQPTDILSNLAELGVMFLLFQIGLEVKPAQLLNLGATAVAVAASGVGLSFVAGTGIALLWGHPGYEALFVGAAVVATSVVITAQVLASLGFLQAKASQTILAAAVVDDVLGLIVLALVSNVARGAVNWAELAFTALGAVGFTVFVAVWGHRAVGRMVPYFDAQFTFAMALLFSLSILAIYAGVAAIIGAFLAGMALSETVDVRVHTMVAGVSELLVPFFLVGIGMSFDPVVLAHRSTLMLALVLLVASIAAKLIACALGAFRMGFRDAIRVGAGMVPRGEVGMVVAQIGRKMGVMSDDIYAIVVFLSVTTTLAAPPLIKLAFRDVKKA